MSGGERERINELPAYLRDDAPLAPAPLDLAAINEELAGAGCLRPRTAAKVLAEVVRLRAENERHQKANLVRAVMRHAEGHDFDGWIADAINTGNFDRVPWLVADSLVKKNEALRAESVPRSALVQVGWRCRDGRLYRFPCCNFAVPIYVIREDTDA